MNLLILKKFNNYFNRIVVKYDTLAKYQDRSDSYVAFTGVNFDYNDGVTTELVVGSTGQQISGAPIDWDESGCPDYLVCYETDANNSVSIKSRWFITESKKNRLGQYTLALKRDSIADHMDETINATCFIEKGAVLNKDDSAIYNKENITTNQIKKDELLLKDETQCGWVVGYVAKQSTATNLSGNIVINPTTFTEQTIPGVDASDSAAAETYADLDAFWEAHPELAGDIAKLNSWSASVKLDIHYTKWFSTYWVGQTLTLYNNGEVSYAESAYENKTGLYQNTNAIGDGWKGWFYDIRNDLTNSVFYHWKSVNFSNFILAQLSAKENVKFKTESDLQTFFNYIKDNKTIKIGNKYYKPYDKYGSEGTLNTVTNEINITAGSNAYDVFNTGLNKAPTDVVGFEYTISGTPKADTFKLAWSYDRHALGLQEIFATCKVKIPASVPLLKDAPYYMFAIPYSDNLTIYKNSTFHCNTSKSVAMNAAQALATKAGAGAVYDLQLLPYCPVRDAIQTEKKTMQTTITYGTYQDMYFTNTNPLLGGDILWYPEPKINHNYVFTRDTNVYDYILGNVFRGHCIKSSSVIKVKIGADLESPSVTKYDAKRIELKFVDETDTSSDKMFYIYSDEAGQNLLTSFTVADYLAGSNLIGIYMTDVITIGEAIATSSALHPEDPPTVTWHYQLCKNGEPMGTMAVWLNTDLLNDYIYSEDYYLSKVDIGKVITSDIVKMVGDTESDIVSTVFWCTESRFSFKKFIDDYYLLHKDTNSNRTFYVKDGITDLINDRVKLGDSINDIKVRNQVEMLRLAAPNYSNFFDFNSQKNNGVEYIDVDCTYRPFAPYMHLNPNFKGLYGDDYNDPRGLICGGDFSIAITTDAWATYQLQNKNYQAVFDRQIQQLEVQQSIQAQSDIANAVAGVGVGAIGGALTGAKIGGVPGAVIGAVAGGAGSAIGGAVDVMNNQRLRELQISTMKDIHGYQLENIKALPQGLAKTTYLTNNNKLFPYLEFYSCTSIEEQAVRDLLDYNGMTINRVGKINEFQTADELPYIKAKLIRINVKDDAHQVKDISDELSMGLYLPKGD